MALNFDKIKQLEPRTHNLIFGYFRDNHKKFFISDNPYYSLQPLLVYTCIMYYFKHEWDTHKISKHVEINDDMLHKTGPDHSTVFVKGEISSGIHEYRFKIIDCTEAMTGWHDIIIGPVPIPPSKEIKIHMYQMMRYGRQSMIVIWRVKEN